MEYIMKKIITGMLILSLFFTPILNISVSAMDIVDTVTADYYADTIYGKIFVEGKNEKVDSPDQLNTMITDVQLFNNDDTSLLSFWFNDKKIEVEAYLLNASINNHDSEHYVFSPIEFVNSEFNIIVMKLTTNANGYDLMPVNNKLEGTTVLSIIMEETSTGDIFYWQGNIQSAHPIRSLSTFNVTYTTSNTSQAVYENIIENSNENYFMNGAQNSFTLTMEEYYDQLSELESSSSEKENISNMNIRSAGTNNPFYDRDIPNSAFQSVTNKWKQRVARSWNSQAAVFSENYYTYSYENYGSDNIYTLIIIIEFRTESFANESNSGYGVSSKQLRIKVIANETVVYYPNEDVYDLGLGLNDIVKFYPTITIKKTGDAVGHIAVSREFGGEGYSNSGVWKSISKAASLGVGIIDGALTGGAITMTLDILDIIYTSVVPERITLGAALHEYGDSVEEQLDKWGYVFGSVRVEMDGYLRSPEDYFFVEGNFTAETIDVVDDTSWTLSYSVNE